MRPERPNLRLERPYLRPERPGLRPEKPNLRPEKPGLRPERLNLRPEKSDLRPEKLNSRPERLDLRGGTNRWTNGWTNKSPPVFHRTSSASGPLLKSSVTDGSMDPQSRLKSHVACK